MVKRVLERTSSGGFCANDTIMHMTIPSLPFGGIGTPIPRNGVLRDPPSPLNPAPAGSCLLPGESCPEPFQLYHHPPPPTHSRSLLPWGWS